MRLIRQLAVVFCLTSGSAYGPAALATDFTFTKFVDATTPVPGGSGNFTAFGIPSLDGNVVAFQGHGPSSQQGIYLGSIGGTLAKIADKNTPVPGGTGNFTFFVSQVSVHQGSVAFTALDAASKFGVYLWSEGNGLVTVANTSTAIPGGTGTFGGFSSPSLYAASVAFQGSGLAQAGIYANVGGTGLVKVADKATPIPGSTVNFTAFGTGVTRPSLTNGKVVFMGNAAASSGVYSFTPGDGLAVVAGAGTMTSDGTTALTSALFPSSGDTSVAFFGFVPGGTAQAVFLASGTAPPELIADTSTQVPGLNTTFSSLVVGTEIAVGAGSVAFVGRHKPTPTTQNDGVYTTLGGALEKVVRSGDVLDGRAAIQFAVGHDGLSGGTLAFNVTLASGSGSTPAIYVAAIPEPAPIALFLAGLGLIAGVAIRNRRAAGAKSGSDHDFAPSSAIR